MHKHTKVTPVSRREIYSLWQNGRSITSLAAEFRTSRPTIYKILERARSNDFSVHKSINYRFRHAMYALRHLSRTEKKVKARLAKRARRYEKDYPGEMVHFDSKKMPRIPGENYWVKREWLFVAIDDYSRYLFADILPNKTKESAGIFLTSCLENMPFPFECAYSDNGTEFKGTPKHDFVTICIANGIVQKFTRVKRPQTNGKAERVIRTIMDEWFWTNKFRTREERRRSLQKYVYTYNVRRLHSALMQGKKKLTPLQTIQNYVNSETVNNA